MVVRHEGMKVTRNQVKKGLCGIVSNLNFTVKIIRLWWSPRQINALITFDIKKKCGEWLGNIGVCCKLLNGDIDELCC